ncbi:MAG: ATP-binding protein [Ilumatobacter sp.]|uniref:sensor histidine kinase n=1 Tax=Ilumatobacter sp. TaxID=1967498 RepID=UPI003297CE90
MTSVDAAGPTPDAARVFPTGVTLVRALAAARWLTWLWMLGVVVVAGNRDVDDPLANDPSGPGTALRQPVVAWSCVLAVLIMCIVATVAVRNAPSRVMSRPFAAVEVGLAFALSAVDGWVFDPGHVFQTSQSLATQYPLIALATAGIAFGPWIAAALGALIGLAELWAAELNAFGPWSLRHVFSIVASSIFFATAGALFGWFARLLRRVERQIADQRARDDVALVLHDTVLQTLALVERRTGADDPELALAARHADRALRRFLFGASALPADDLEGRVRHAVERASRHHDVSVTVNVVDVGCSVGRAGQEAVAGAVGEAVTNAIKHASAGSIVVYVETDDDGEIFASVRDDGAGFDPVTVHRGQGLDGSIVGRVRAVGGRTEIVSAPGAGAEVRVWSR